MRAVLWLNSNGPTADIQRSIISEADLIVGIDGGSDRAQRAGVQVDLILGDLDSTENSHEGVEKIQLGNHFLRNTKKIFQKSELD